MQCRASFLSGIPCKLWLVSHNGDRRTCQGCRISTEGSCRNQVKLVQDTCAANSKAKEVGLSPPCPRCWTQNYWIWLVLPGNLATPTAGLSWECWEGLLCVLVYQKFVTFFFILSGASGDTLDLSALFCSLPSGIKSAALIRTGNCSITEPSFQLRLNLKPGFGTVKTLETSGRAKFIVH